jgi:hypothetical protein
MLLVLLVLVLLLLFQVDLRHYRSLGLHQLLR